MRGEAEQTRPSETFNGAKEFSQEKPKRSKKRRATRITRQRILVSELCWLSQSNSHQRKILKR